MLTLRPVGKYKPRNVTQRQIRESCHLEKNKYWVAKCGTLFIMRDLVTHRNCPSSKNRSLKQLMHVQLFRKLLVNGFIVFFPTTKKSLIPILTYFMLSLSGPRIAALYIINYNIYTQFYTIYSICISVIYIYSEHNWNKDNSIKNCIYIIYLKRKFVV